MSSGIIFTMNRSSIGDALDNLLQGIETVSEEVRLAKDSLDDEFVKATSSHDISKVVKKSSKPKTKKGRRRRNRKPQPARTKESHRPKRRIRSSHYSITPIDETASVDSFACVSACSAFDTLSQASSAVGFGDVRVLNQEMQWVRSAETKPETASERTRKSSPIHREVPKSKIVVERTTSPTPKLSPSRRDSPIRSPMRRGDESPKRRESPLRSHRVSPRRLLQPETVDWKRHGSPMRKTPSEKKLMKSPSERRLNKSPNVGKLDRTPSERRLVKSPSERKLTKAPSERKLKKHDTKNEKIGKKIKKDDTQKCQQAIDWKRTKVVLARKDIFGEGLEDLDAFQNSSHHETTWMRFV